MIDGILAAEEWLASRVARFVHTYTRQIAGGVGATLMMAGGGAFAVASLGPDAADLPVRQVFEAVQPQGLQVQADLLDTHSFTLYRNESTRSSDTAESLLRRLGVADAGAAAFIRGNAEARAALFSRPGRTVTAEATADNALLKLSARWLPQNDGSFRRLVIEKQAGQWRARTESDTLAPATRLASGVVRSSLFAATDDAGIPDAVAGQLADIFGSDVDFRQLRRGDRFAVVYETFEADGQQLRTGRVLSAEFASGGKTHQALWFQEPGQKGAYYRPNGQSLRKAFLATPLEFSRMTSGFAMRLHPILNSWRQHKGIDLSAPIGTAVRTVGDGVVEFAGQQNGYGNFVVVKHRNEQSTAYAHLSRIDVKAGDSVSQGQTIGAVGMTGWSTGPHLHFEYRVNGEYADPSTIAQQEGGQPISAASRTAFERMALTTRAELSAAFSVVQARAD